MSKKSILLGLLVLGSFGSSLYAVLPGANGGYVWGAPGVGGGGIPGASYSGFAEVSNSHFNSYQRCVVTGNLPFWLARQRDLVERALAMAHHWTVVQRGEVLYQFFLAQLHAANFLSSQSAFMVANLVQALGETQLLLMQAAVQFTEEIDRGLAIEFLGRACAAHVSVLWCLAAQPFDGARGLVAYFVCAQHALLPRVIEVLSHQDPWATRHIVAYLSDINYYLAASSGFQQEEVLERLIELQRVLLPQVIRVVDGSGDDKDFAYGLMNKVCLAHQKVAGFSMMQACGGGYTGLIDSVSALQGDIALQAMSVAPGRRNDQTRGFMTAVLETQALLDSWYGSISDRASDTTNEKD